jgi:hypothetical protein
MNLLGRKRKRVNEGSFWADYRLKALFLLTFMNAINFLWDTGVTSHYWRAYSLLFISQA